MLPNMACTGMGRPWCIVEIGFYFVLRDGRVFGSILLLGDRGRRPIILDKQARVHPFRPGQRSIDSMDRRGEPVNCMEMINEGGMAAK
jgi:hypothetical protein